MQKFFRGHRVKIAAELPSYMSHFDGAGCEAIVRGSYADLCGSIEGDIDYSLLILGDKPASCAWYEEGLLTLVSSDRDAGEMILQEYKNR